MPIRARLVLGFGCALGLAHQAPAEAPLSAIDWLSSSVSAPAGSTVGAPEPDSLPKEAPVTTGGALPAQVAVSVLDGQSPDALGLLSPSTTGLPRDLWGMGLEAEVLAAIARERTDLLPALQSLSITLMLAEAAPPADNSGSGALLLARIDRLLAMGALDQASSLLDLAPKENPEVFRRAFDVALLTGNEDRGCDLMQAIPNLAPTFPARIFCLARSGDWNAAALTLRTAQALGYVSEEEDALLSRFLDPDLFEGDSLPPIPARMTPLSWRMFEAIGEPQPTNSLPLAFSHAELRDTAGWKGQIEAAERLVRAGVISPNALLGLYTERLPAASGGVWDRVDAFQRFESALRAGDAAAVASRLPAAYAKMAEVELEVPFAALFAQDLSRLPLAGDAGRLAFEIGLLSQQFETVARARTSETPRDQFLIGLATGSVAGTTPPDTLGRAIAPAFLQSGMSAEFTALMDQNRMGEAILLAIEKIGRGVQGELTGVTDGLAFLRHIGMETVARQTALELMLLERRG